MYLDRLLLLHQRLRRDKTFSRPALALSDTDEQNAYCQVNHQCALYGNCFQQSCRTAAMFASQVCLWLFALGFHSARCCPDSLPWGMAQTASELRNAFSEALACLLCS